MNSMIYSEDRKSFATIVHNLLIPDQLNEMGGTCSAFGGDERRGVYRI